MNSFLGLFFCSLAPAVTFAWNANEKPLFIPLSVTQNQRHNPRPLPSFPGFTIQKFLLLKHALELKCLKELCNHVRYRHICYGGRPFQGRMPRPPLQPTPQQQILFFNRIKANSSAIQNGRFIHEDKMNYLPPKKYFNNIRINPLPQKESKTASNTQQKLSIILPRETSKIVQEKNSTGQLLPEDKEFRNLPQEIKKVASKNEDIATRSSDKEKPDGVKPTRAPTLLPQHQYEVKEIIDEKPEAYKYSNDFKGFQMGSKRLANVSLLMKNKPNIQEFKNTSPVLKHEEALPAFFTNHYPRVLTVKSNEPQSQHQQQPDRKNLLNNYFQTLNKNTTDEPKTHATTFKSINFSSEHVNKADLLRATTQTEKYTTSLYTSKVVVTETKVNHSELTKTSESVGDIQLLGPTHPNNPNFIPSSTEEIIQDSSRFPVSTSPSAMTSSETHTTSSVFWQTSDNWRSTEDSIVSSSSETELFLDTKNQRGTTTPSLKEITTEPDFQFLTKLNPAIKKDHDSSLKNSRKMHFGQETWKINENEIPDFEYNAPRRSDILISENGDYFDYDNNFSGMNYLKKLQLNHSLDLQNLTLEAIIPLIPKIVIDLREDKLSPEDISTLSEVFGKYWTSVMDLSNNTVLDMLPVMKLKDESDLENLIRSLHPEERPSETATEVDDHNYFTLGYYDFIENYKDLSMENEPLEEYNIDITNVTPEY